MSVTVLLVRHARSTANAAGVLAGRAPGVDLDQIGRSQAEALCRRLASVRLAALYGSPMDRCRQTVAGLNMDYQVHEGLTECDYGTWTGRTLEDCGKDPLWPVIQASPSTVRFPEGESFSEMSARAARTIRDLASTVAGGEVIACVSHGDPIKAIVADAIGLPLDGFQSLVVDPASVTVLRYTDNRAFLVRLNDSGTALGALVHGADGAVIGGGAGPEGQSAPDPT